MNKLTRRAVAVLVAALTVTAVTASAPAVQAQQHRQPDRANLRVMTGGTISVTYTLDGHTHQLPADLFDGPHSHGWTGEGTWTVVARDWCGIWIDGMPTVHHGIVTDYEPVVTCTYGPHYRS